MHGLPEDFDPRAFMGAELSQLCISVNTTSLSFDGHRGITLLGSFAYRAREGDLSTYSVPEGSESLLRLPGKTVVAATVESGCDLRLVFDDGQVIVCLDDSTAYESYSLSIDGREIFV